VRFARLTGPISRLQATNVPFYLHSVSHRKPTSFITVVYAEAQMLLAFVMQSQKQLKVVQLFWQKWYWQVSALITASASNWLTHLEQFGKKIFDVWYDKHAS
jgi:hypothetical protein